MKIFYSIFIFVIGVCLGSFYACLGYRIPNKISLVKPGSRCDFCKKKLKWYMNIPLFSYIFLNGKCAYCKSKLEISMFLIELFTGLCFSISYIYFSFSLDFMIMIILISNLSILLISDIKYYYVSDRVTFISLILEIISYIYFLGFNESKFYLISMIISFLLMFLIKITGDKIFKKESLGGGDVKLMLIMGLTLGIYNCMIALLISSVLALLSYLIFKKDEDSLIPYGPFLIFATIITYLLSYNGIGF